MVNQEIPEIIKTLRNLFGSYAEHITVINYDDIRDDPAEKIFRNITTANNANVLCIYSDYYVYAKDMFDRISAEKLASVQRLIFRLHAKYH